MKPQAAMILCEWDSKNLLRTLPTSTWMGERWNNARWDGPWLEAAADIIRSDHLELTLHGIGHEFWQPSPSGALEFTRAEWHDRDGTMRPHDEIRRRLDMFGRLLDQHNLGAFPTSFVPCAFLHRFADNDDGLAAILKEYGISFISTPFSTMFGTEHVQNGLFGFDAEVMTVDRGQDLQRWFTIGEAPEGELEGPICGMHWPNFLHPDPRRNEETVRSWVEFLKPYNDRVDRMLAPDTATFATQLAHRSFTAMAMEKNAVSFDFSAFNRLPKGSFNDSFYLKLLTARNAPIPEFVATGVAVASSESRCVGNGCLHNLQLTRRPDTASGHIEWRWSPGA